MVSRTELKLLPMGYVNCSGVIMAMASGNRVARPIVVIDEEAEIVISHKSESRNPA
jgi:hypothetical protein